MQSSQMFNMPKKRVFAVFSSSIFEICSRNANIGICSIRKCSTCPKNAILHCFHHQFFEICSRNVNKGICSNRKCSTCRKNAFLYCFHHQLSKIALETQIKAYAVLANVQHPKKTRFCSVFIINF